MLMLMIEKSEAAIFYKKFVIVVHEDNGHEAYVRGVLTSFTDHSLLVQGNHGEKCLISFDVISKIREVI